jgi:iron complex transport system ATP-binding protein
VSTILAAFGVDASYRRAQVLHGVDLSVAAGDRLAIVGPNGAGKSTLLRVLGGLIVPSAGRVELTGRSVTDLDRAAVARALAFVPQEPSIPFAMSVEELVGLGRLPHEDPFRGARPADRAAIASAIERVGVGHLLGRDVRELSLGERQLVLIAFAVTQATPVLVLDEPTVHLDLRHQVDVMRLLVDLNERDGTSIIAVLHDLTLAAHFFPRVVMMDAGRIVADGPPATTIDDDHIRQIFGVDPAIVRLPVATA